MILEALPYLHYVYGIYVNEECVYIGVTKNLVSRAATHSPHFPRNAVMRILHGTNSRVQAEVFEGREIRSRPNLRNRAKTTPFPLACLLTDFQLLALRKYATTPGEPRIKITIQALEAAFNKLNLYPDKKNALDWLTQKGLLFPDVATEDVDPMSDPAF